MPDAGTNIFSVEHVNQILAFIEKQGLIVSKYRASKLLGTSRETFNKDYVETKFITPLPNRKRDRFSLIDVLTMPERMKERVKLNVARGERQEVRSLAQTKSIEEIFESCYKAVKRGKK